MDYGFVRSRRARRLLVRAVMTAAAALAVSSSVASAATDGRSRDFDQGWKFALVNSADTTDPTGAYADAMDPSFDDSSWRSVDVPHDWSNELAFTNAPGAGTDSGTGWLPGGLGWYGKTFTLPAADAGKRISLEFDGVYEDSYVYVNDHLVGNHPYGYTGFAVDLTPFAHTGGAAKNVVAVKVQNKLPGSRWYPGSGIERNVHLVVTDPDPRRPSWDVRDDAGSCQHLRVGTLRDGQRQDHHRGRRRAQPARWSDQSRAGFQRRRRGVGGLFGDGGDRSRKSTAVTCV